MDVFEKLNYIFVRVYVLYTTGFCVYVVVLYVICRLCYGPCEMEIEMSGRKQGAIDFVTQFSSEFLYAARALYSLPSHL